LDKDEQVFLAAAILLSAAVGQRHEPVDEKQVALAVGNARKLYVEVQKQNDEAGNALPIDGVQKAMMDQQAKRTGKG
jgi:hypothetical protein